MSEFHEHAPNVKNFQFLEKKDQIFRKIRENFGNVQIIQKIIQDYSVVSLISELGTEVEELAGKISGAESDLSGATKLRDEEKAAFSATL